MLRRLLLGQRKRQDNEDNEENKEVILITQNKEEEKWYRLKIVWLFKVKVRKINETKK